MRRTSCARKRARGESTVLESGSFRIKVYAGRDALSGKRLYLTEVVPAGPRLATPAGKLANALPREAVEEWVARS